MERDGWTDHDFQGALERIEEKLDQLLQKKEKKPKPDDNPEHYAVLREYLSMGKELQERRVTGKVQWQWNQTFPDPEWVLQQMNMALAWEASNPARKKKNFAAFITRWLTKAWDYRKTQPGSQGTNWDKVFGDVP